MSFYEQLCQLNDEDLPEIKWLEVTLDELKPDRDEVCDFIAKLEGEIKQRKERLTELELELRKQSRRLEFAIDCKECLATYAATKLVTQSFPSSFRPSVPPRSNSLKKSTPSPSASKNDNESDYIKLSECYSAKPEQPVAPKMALIPEVGAATVPEKSSTVRLRRRPLENASMMQNAQGRRHTLDEDKMHKRAMERMAQQQQPSLRPLASNCSPAPSSVQPSESGNQPYVNIDQFQIDKISDSLPVQRHDLPPTVAECRESMVSPANEAAMIDEHFGFLDNELASSGDMGNSSGTGDVMTSSTENDHTDKIAETRRNLITGYIADQRDYLSILETVVKYSKAIQSTLTSPKPDVISATDFTTIFGLLPKIFEIEKFLIDQLDERMGSWSPNEPIFAPLVSEREKYAERFSLYALYLRDYPVILETATRCMKESVKFNETCGEIIVTDRKQGKIKRKFEDVLLLPIVRLQSSGLALERIIEATPPSHPDQTVLISMRQKLRTSLDGPVSLSAVDGVTGPSALASPKRQVLRPAVPLVEWLTPPITSKLATLTVDSIRKLRYTFLFTDVFVACKRKLGRNGRVQFEALWWLQVSDLKLEDLPPTKVDQAVKSKLEELSHEILLIRRNLLSITRGFGVLSQTQAVDQRKRLLQLEETWLLSAPLVPLRIYNGAAEATNKQPLGTVATTNESKLILFLSDFELGDWRRALHACQMRLMGSPTAPTHFSKEFLTLLCNEVAEKIGINNQASHPRVAVQTSANTLTYQHQISQPSPFNHDAIGSIVASSSTEGIDFVSPKNSQDSVFNSMGFQQVSGQLLVTVHELTGLAFARQCSVALSVDCFGHFQIQAQTRLSESSISPRWSDAEFELDLNSSSAMRVVCYSREPDGRDVIVGQSALQLTQDWLKKPFVENQIGLLATTPTDQHLSLTLTIRYREPHMTMSRRSALAAPKSGSLFGQALGDVVTRDRSETAIPRIVTECVRRIEAADGLNQEGLYRISGLVGEVKRIKAAFEKDLTSAREQLHMADVNVATGVLKSYFRELPDPLFTEVLSQDCLNLVAETSQQLETMALADILQQATSIFERLPKPNRKTAYFLLQHLCRVADRCDKNLMTAENLARIWGPTLIAPPTTGAPVLSASTIYLQGQVLLIFLQLVSSGYKLPD